MTAPRVWVGMDTECPSHWVWCPRAEWTFITHRPSMHAGDIFCVTVDEPEIDVDILGAIATCKVVDW